MTLWAIVFSGTSESMQETLWEFNRSHCYHSIVINKGSFEVKLFIITG